MRNLMAKYVSRVDPELELFPALLSKRSWRTVINGLTFAAAMDEDPACREEYAALAQDLHHYIAPFA